MHPTMTAEQAADRVERNARAALAGLGAGAELAEAGSGAVDCADPDDHGPLGRITRYAEYVVTGVPPAELDGRFDTVLQWWRGNGFRVLADARPAQRYLWAEHDPDGFRMALQANERGELFLTSTSPCVWPEGTPAR